MSHETTDRQSSTYSPSSMQTMLTADIEKESTAMMPNLVTPILSNVRSWRVSNQCHELSPPPLKRSSSPTMLVSPSRTSSSSSSFESFMVELENHFGGRSVPDGIFLPLLLDNENKENNNDSSSFVVPTLMRRPVKKMRLAVSIVENDRDAEDCLR